MSARLPAALVKAMWWDYTAGLSLRATADKYDRNRNSLRELFLRRGLNVRPVPYTVVRLANGRIAPAKKATPERINQLIAGLKRLSVPNELAREWRLWPMERRMEFIRLARKRFPSTRPTGPFSANVKPFDYGTPAARQIMNRMNRGRNSRDKLVQLKPACGGVIFERRLYHWISGHHEKGAGYFVGNWKPGIGRPSLHHIIWERANKRKVPAGFTVIHQDDNKNNLEPSNLVLRSRADCARQNMTRWRLKRSRELTSLLLKKSQNHERNNIYSALRKRAPKLCTA